MRKVLLTLVVSAVLTLPAAAATRSDTDPGNVVHRIIARLRGAVIHVLDELGTPKP
jgi:hypothetical protein